MQYFSKWLTEELSSCVTGLSLGEQALLVSNNTSLVNSEA